MKFHSRFLRLGFLVCEVDKYLIEEVSCDLTLKTEGWWELVAESRIDTSLVLSVANIRYSWVWYLDPTTPKTKVLHPVVHRSILSWQPTVPMPMCSIADLKPVKLRPDGLAFMFETNQMMALASGKRRVGSHWKSTLIHRISMRDQSNKIGL